MPRWLMNRLTRATLSVSSSVRRSCPFPLFFDQFSWKAPLCICAQTTTTSYSTSSRTSSCVPSRRTRSLECPGTALGREKGGAGGGDGGVDSRSFPASLHRHSRAQQLRHSTGILMSFPEPTYNLNCLGASDFLSSSFF